MAAREGRRTVLKLLAAGALGLALGGIGGYFAGTTSAPRSTVTTTVTETVTAAPKPAKRKVRALWVYVGPIGDYGWTYAHDEGRRYAEKVLGAVLETKYMEKIPEEQAYVQAKSALEKEEFNAVFFTSYGYMDAVKRLAREFPDVAFYHCSGPWEEFRDLPNVTTYFAELYQVYYLNGLAAGAVTETCRVGYIPAFLIPEVVRHINAFAIGAVEGARAAGKCGNGEKLEVYVTAPLKSWFAPDKARDAARMLVDQYGVDVIAYTEDSTAVLETAESYWDQGVKVYSFSHYTNMYEYFARRGVKLRSHLTGQVANWGPIYVYLLSKLAVGAYEKEDVWARLGDFVPIRWRRPVSESRAGEPEGAVYLAPLNEKAIPGKVLELIKRRYEEMKELLFEPFTGPLRGYTIDSEGRPQESPKLKVERGQRLGRNELWSMNWFYEKIVPLAK